MTLKIVSISDAVGVSKPFSEIAAGEAPEEVARLFLSSLMLANTYNVDLTSASGLPLAMDDAELTLLSTQRHHENMFDSPEKPTTGPGRKGKSRKFLDSDSSGGEEEANPPARKKRKRVLKPSQRGRAEPSTSQDLDVDVVLERLEDA